MLHSLDVARHPSQLVGEIDFVVIVPEQGVLCIEVKSGAVARRGGLWTYGRDEQARSSTQSPFAQAAHGMHGIRKHLARLDPALNAILFYSAVFFTSIDFEEISMEWQPWQIADRSALSRGPVSDCCLRMLRCAHDHVRKTTSAQWYHTASSKPSVAQVERLVDVLRGDFEFAISPRTALDEAEDAIRRFTQEQYAALDVLEDNPRVVFKGPAGTGKTFLALEAARRSALAGRRTLLACASRLGGRWLADQVADQPNPAMIVAGCTDSLWRGMAVVGAKRRDVDTAACESPAVIVVEQAFAGSVSTPAFDTIILDNGHELMDDETLDALDVLLAGGLAGGRWAVFGDFGLPLGGEAEPKVEPLVSLARRAPVHFTFPLRVNCRATPELARAVEAAWPATQGYSRVLRETGGPEPRVFFFRNIAEQKQLLMSSLVELLRVYAPNEIVILSSKGDGDSCSAQLASENPGLGLKSLTESPAKPHQLGFTSIHEFRGLESPAVILTDVGTGNADPTETLYAGISRARHQTVILASAEWKGQLRLWASLDRVDCPPIS